MDEIDILFKRAIDALDGAEFNFKNGYYNISINRSYYAVFYASKALLLKKGVETKTHAGNIKKFGLEYVVNDNFEARIAKILSELEEDRSNVDYSFEFEGEKIQAKENLKNAEKFIAECKRFL
ncbi:MAG: HEPN domain-containing protein [Methanobrevibacter sp.]|nr:HEPN domain-containing protein [Methanobrevibacter sp.]